THPRSTASLPVTTTNAARSKKLQPPENQYAASRPRRAQRGSAARSEGGPGDPRAAASRAPDLISRFEVVRVLHGARVCDLRVLELLQLLDQAALDLLVVERAPDDLHLRRLRHLLPGGVQRQHDDHAPFERAVVLLVQDLLVAPQRRRVPLLEQELDL